MGIKPHEMAPRSGLSDTLMPGSNPVWGPFQDCRTWPDGLKTVGIKPEEDLVTRMDSLDPC